MTSRTYTITFTPFDTNEEAQEFGYTARSDREAPEIGIELLKEKRGHVWGTVKVFAPKISKPIANGFVSASRE